MSASPPRYEQAISVGRLALDRGDLATAERELRVAVRTIESLDGTHVEHVVELIKLAEMMEETGATLEAETLLRRALEVGEEALGDTHLGLVPALRSLGAVLLLRGAAEQVEPLLTRALAIAEQHLGTDHPDLVPLLNDLTRLYLKRSAYDCAEPLLLRLLEIKRSTGGGEDRPEVATIIATLATVRQALGRHDAAEQLWRRVLEIRERTLAPNHFAIGTTLEHLAESCAARGKLAEALAMFRRAHTLIELTLGAEHASLVTLRERIADLQLQAADESLLASSIAGESLLVSPMADERSLVSPTNDVLALQKELDELEEREARGGRVRSMGAASVGARLRDGPVWVAITALIAAVVGTGLIVARIDAAGDGRQSQFAEGFARVEPEPAASAASSADSSSPVVRPATGTVEASSPSPPAKTFLRAPAAASPDESVSRRSARRAVEEEEDAPSVALPIVASTTLVRLDSVLRSVAVPTRGVSESSPAQLALILPLTGRALATRDYVDALSAPTSARVIGALPEPRYPEGLLASKVNGEVVIEVVVDTTGRPELATVKVVRSSHAQFLAAVRKVVPRIRFEPARVAGPGSRPRTDVVSLQFQFLGSSR